jgi:predicted MPP superfamily phosphohydrolase
VLLVTDLHVERQTRRERRLLEVVARRQPQLILIGGDLLNLSYVGEPRAIRECRDLLARLRAPAGVFFVRGTWDVDPPKVVGQILEGLPVRQLDNEVAVVDHGQGARLQLLGVTADLPPAQRAQRLEQLMRRTDRDQPRVVVHHTPDLAPLAARLGADLYLAGHTHGGQICLPLLGPLATGSRLGRRFVRGTHRLGSTSVHVSRGLGLEGLGAPRMRFLSRPELVWITLLPGGRG